MTWADLYDHCSVAAKKMIILQFIKSIHVHKNYDDRSPQNGQLQRAEVKRAVDAGSFIGELN